MKNLDLGSSFIASVLKHSDFTAVVDGDKRLSYREIADKVCTVASGLQNLGIAKGERIVCVLQNRLEAMIIYWACQLTGIIFTPVNWRYSAEEIEYIIDSVKCAAISYEEISQAAVNLAVGDRPIKKIAIACRDTDGLEFSDICQGSSRLEYSACNLNDLSILLHTSGTTAKPKGVARSHKAERASAISQALHNTQSIGEITLGVMPIYHTMGIRSLITSVLMGGTFVCMRKFDPLVALELIEKERITNLCLVPTLFHDILSHEKLEDFDITSAKNIAFAGASMSEALTQKILRKLTPDRFINQYGCTEIYLLSVEAKYNFKRNSAGKPGINQIIRVVSMGSKDPAFILPAFQIGQIIASMSSDEAFEGYWNDPKADAESIIDGWYFTGDIGYFDEDGDLFITGRADDIIISGGENISPIEVENCLGRHPQVSEVVVFGLEDERFGKIVAAAVKSKSKIDICDLDKFCVNSGLANFKRPRRYFFVDSIPKSPVGKILRRVLKSQFEHEC